MQVEIITGRGLLWPLTGCKGRLRDLVSHQGSIGIPLSFWLSERSPDNPGKAESADCLGGLPSPRTKVHPFAN